MERIIQVDESRKGVHTRLTHRVNALLGLTQGIEFAVIYPSFRGETGSASFKQTPHLDAVPDVFERELPHDEAPSRVGFEPSFVRQPLQSQPNWSTRYTEPECERMF